MKEDIILKVEGLKKAFGSLMAVDGVNLSFPKGVIFAIIGPNGAGKTTFFNLVTGKLVKTAGKVYFKGEDISRLTTHEIIRKGIGRSFQITNILPRISVCENVLTAIISSEGKASQPFLPLWTFREERKRAYEILEQVKLSGHANKTAGTLAHGNKKHLEIAMVLALDPEVLLLDEPTAGMTPKETEETVDLIREIAHEKNVIFTEHDMKVVFGISQRIAVLHEGKIIAEGEPSEIQNNRFVRTAYLGEEI